MVEKHGETLRPKDDESTRDLAILARAVLEAIPGRTRLDQLHNLQRLLGVALHAAAGHPDLFRYYRDVLPEGVVRTLLALAQQVAPTEAKVHITEPRTSDVVEREAPTMRRPVIARGSRSSSVPPRANCIACSGETFCVTNTEGGTRLSCVMCGSMFRVGEITRIVTVPYRDA